MFDLSALLEVVQQYVEGLRLLTEVADHNARAGDHLAGLRLLVELAQTSPLAELLRVGDLDQVDVVLKAQRLNQPNVLGLLAVLSQNAKVSLKKQDILMMRPSTANSEPKLLSTWRLSRARAHSFRPRARPSWMRAFFRTSCRAVKTAISPEGAATSVVVAAAPASPSSAIILGF